MKLAPDDIDYLYLIAYAHYLARDYDAAIKLINGLKKHDDINQKIYQMLGNCFDMNNEPYKVTKSYEKARKFSLTQRFFTRNVGIWN